MLSAMSHPQMIHRVFSLMSLYIANEKTEEALTKGQSRDTRKIARLPIHMLPMLIHRQIIE